MPLVSRCLALSTLLTLGARAEDSPAAKPTTAPVFLPDWDPKSWALVRGSVIDTNPTASETTYTIFCPEQTPPACGLSLEFPFELVEGPDTIDFHGTYTSTYIVNLGCQLEGTTSAKCSGYSSYRSGYSNGWITGPTEIEWTKTLTGSDVEWGVLTMGEKPTHTDDYLDINESDITQPTTKSPDDRAMPAETGSAAGRSAMREKDWMMCTILMTAILTAVVL